MQVRYLGTLRAWVFNNSWKELLLTNSFEVSIPHLRSFILTEMVNLLSQAISYFPSSVYEFSKTNFKKWCGIIQAHLKNLFEKLGSAISILYLVSLSFTIVNLLKFTLFFFLRFQSKIFWVLAKSDESYVASKIPKCLVREGERSYVWSSWRNFTVSLISKVFDS